MFGLLTDTPEDEVGWGNARLSRFSRRSFRDVDWGALAAASAQLTALGVNAIAQATHSGAYATQTATQAQCPQGLVYNPQTQTCVPLAPASSNPFANIDPMTLAIGGGVLLLVLLAR